MMQYRQLLVLTYQFLKIFKQRILAPSRFEFWFHPCKYDIGESVKVGFAITTIVYVEFGILL